MTTVPDGRRDRTGEIPIDPEHDPDCTGWLGEDANDNPRPCLICKPHLAPGERRRQVHGRRYR